MINRPLLVWTAGIALLLAGCSRPHPEPSQVPADDAAPAPTVSFTDVTEEAGLGGFRHVTGAFGEKWFPETMGSGGGFFDYDGDGDLDILLAGGGVWPATPDTVGFKHALWLYRNDGDGTFTLQTEAAGLGGAETYALGFAAADYDNDGDQDFLLTTLYRNLLFRNDGDGTFTEVGRQVGLSEKTRWSSSAIFFDADRDGWLDLYVGNYVDWSPENDLFCTIDGETKAYCTPEEYKGIPSRFYLGNGDGTFSDWTKEAGFLPAPGKTLGVAMLDYNRDGWPDLVVANDLERNLLYENDGDGTFTERGVVSGVAFDENGRARAGMGIDVGVVDSTGEPTIFVGNFSGEMIGVYRHLRDGLFLNRAAVSQIGRPSLPTLTFGLFLFDVDFDGDLDLFAANGHIAPSIEAVSGVTDYEQPVQLFLNRGGGTFEEIDVASGPLAEPLVARGAAYGDYDGDGDLDVLITESGGPAHLWRNNLMERSGSEEGPHYLRVELRGRESNRDGIGARVVAVVNGKHQTRLVHTGSSYLSQSELAVTFGLGQATRVDTLRVQWPSGRVDQRTGVEADQTVRVVEGTHPVHGARAVTSAAR